MKVRNPAGAVYRVRRRWLPWKRKLRIPEGMDVPMMSVSVPDDPVFGTILLVVLAVFLVPVLIVLAAVLSEFLLLLLLAPAAVLLRTFFGHPWTIDVTQKRRLVWSEEIKGWAASRDRIRQLGTGIKHGEF